MVHEKKMSKEELKKLSKEYNKYVEEKEQVSRKKAEIKKKFIEKLKEIFLKKIYEIEYFEDYHKIEEYIEIWIISEVYSHLELGLRFHKDNYIEIDVLNELKNKFENIGFNIYSIQYNNENKINYYLKEVNKK